MGVRSVRLGYVLQGQVGHGEERRPYFYLNGKYLKSLNHSSDFITPAALWKMYSRTGQNGKERDQLIDY